MADVGWVFGYGSLIWKVDFPVVESREGHIHGFVRRLWQGSTDHRGTAAAPGRVASILTAAEHRAALAAAGVDEEEVPLVSCPQFADGRPLPVVWGVAYRLDPQLREATLAALDHREKCGYVREIVQVCCVPDGRHAGDTVAAYVYRATPDNDEFLGPAAADAESVASHVLRASGPSGTNLQYVVRLQEALHARGVRDQHIDAVVAEAERLRQTNTSSSES